ncbi:heavy metal-binding protein HIP-like isoform X2 [Poecilia latipinna]|uniref:heavy metal-binding protein HIP-like isoform X2 n=1 Tax=Poecilia latipinna TaxID=48699 RepID=UPI00072DA0ED|nr:PREDICTED: heavy metal-binding protein HIP-like isoform X2 [Poecilia latipinna]
MNFTLWLLLSFCGLTLGQEGLPETEVTTETGSCFPDMCKFLKEFAAMKAKLESVETNLKETESRVLVLKQKGEALETKLNDSERHVVVLKEKGKTLETKLKETESHVLVLKQKALKVVFSAGILGNAAIGPFSTPRTLIYTRVITNLGNAYNQNTGIFVAPVGGMYYFSFFYHAGGGHKVRLLLMKNNEHVLESSDHKTLNDGADNGGNAAFVELQQGDQVYVQLHPDTHVFGGSHTTTFSGFLLHQV